MPALSERGGPPERRVCAPAQTRAPPVRASALAEPHPEGMAAAVVELLDDPDRRYAMGLRARALAEGPWSWGARARTLDTLYTGLVGAPERSTSIS